MKKELWNAYTADGTLTDIVLTRGEPIPTGLCHMVCEVLVKHTDGSYLCMKRASTKPANTYPGYYEATAGGSALLGETKEECIKRELKEETGIDEVSFELIGRTVTKDTIYYTFVCTTDWNKTNITLQQGETEDFVWMSERDFTAFVNSNDFIPVHKERYKEYFIKMGYLR